MIYEFDSYIKPYTKINTLAGTPRKMLSLFATLSRTNKIVFDLLGQDPSGAEKILDIVYDYVNQGGAAILLDNFDDPDLKYTKRIKLEISE